jgi:hypothetical protein
MGRPRKNPAPPAGTGSAEKPEFTDQECYAIESFAHDAVRAMCAPSADPPELIRWTLQCGQEYVRQMRQLRAGRGSAYPAEPLPPAEEAPPVPPDPPKSPEELLRERLILRFPAPPGFCRHAAFADMGDADNVDAELDSMLADGFLEHEGLKGLRLTKAGEELARTIVKEGGKP